MARKKRKKKKTKAELQDEKEIKRITKKEQVKSENKILRNRNHGENVDLQQELPFQLFLLC